MDLKEAIKYALDGEAIVFLGAGFSIGAIDKDGEKLKTAKALSLSLCEELGINTSENLTFSSKVFFDERGEVGLVDFLKEKLICHSISQEQKEICNLMWRRIYTTNFDDVAEKACHSNGYTKDSIVATMGRYDKRINKEGAIIHINGYIKKITKGRFLEEFKITNDSYLKTGFLETCWRSFFENDIRQAKAVVFVGYSLKYDLDLQKLIYSKEIKDKCVFVDTEYIDAEARYYIEKDFGTLDTCGTKGLGSLISDIRKSYTPRPKLTKLKGIVEYNNGITYKGNPTSKNVIDLLDKGKLEERFLYNKEPYVIKRLFAYNSIKKNIEDKNIFLLHSHLGNGKSVALEYLASMLKMTNDYHVFKVKNFENISEEIDIIIQQASKRIVLIIDDIDMYLDKIKDITNQLPDQITLILTTRSVMLHRVLYNLNEFGVTNENSLLIDLNKLEPEEIRSFEILLTRYRLWGEYDTRTSNEKKKIIRKKYKKEVASAVFGLIESGIIENKLVNLFERAIITESTKNFLIASSINSICNLKLKFHNIIALTNTDVQILKNDNRDPEISEFIDFQNEDIKIRSSLYAIHFIKQFVNDDDMFEIISEMYFNAEKLDYNGQYYKFKKNIIARSNLVHLINKKNYTSYDEIIAKFYSGIMNEQQVSKNPFFWLQFAITMLNLEELSSAKIYFNNAYSNAEELDDFDTFQLDTHYSRYLFEYTMAKQYKSEDTINEITNAHKYLMRNSNNNSNLKFVLRQVRYYNKCYKKFGSQMSTIEIEKFRKIISIIPGKYEEYFEAIKQMDYIDNLSRQSFLELIDLYEQLNDKVSISRSIILHNKVSTAKKIKF